MLKSLNSRPGATDRPRVPAPGPPGRATLRSLRWFGAALLWAAVPWVAADSLEFALSGVEGRLARQLTRHLDVALGERGEDISPTRIRALHRRAPAQLTAGLEALGYYGSKVDAALVRDGAKWRAAYHIEPGEPVRVVAVELSLDGEARGDAAFEGFDARFPLQPGAVLNHARYEEGKRELEHLLADRGYFDARIRLAEVAVDPPTRTARVRFAVDSGARYRFGPVLWPDTVLAPDVLARFTSFSPDEPYSADALLELQSRLADSNYFASVAVTPRSEEAADHAVPVAVELDPRKPQRYSLGAGFGTDTGPRGRAAWQRPYVNRRGHWLETDLRVSAVQSLLAGTYGVPLPPRHTDTLSLRSNLLSENTDVSDTLRLQLGAEHATTRFGWQERIGLDYELERFDVGNDTETSGLLIPSVRWTRTWADDRLRTRRGLRLGLDLRGAQSSLLSRISFLQLRIDGKLIRTLGETRVIARGEFGATATSDFDRLPVSHRFFAGGDTSLRGFDFRSLGPRDADGKVVGGRYLALAGLELEHPIRERWSGAVFSDFGNAVDSLSDRFEYSVGAGLRWESPVGPLRVDIANGLSDDDRPWRLHIVVGPDL
jgi:translocation and assembly module TamA